MCEISARMFSLLSGLYSMTESAVKYERCISSLFTVNMGVRQDYVFSLLLFNTFVNWDFDNWCELFWNIC